MQLHAEDDALKNFPFHHRNFVSQGNHRLTGATVWSRYVPAGAEECFCI
jgi:hypothetical protein